MKQYYILKKWNDEYDGAGIYSIKSPDGKRYIGQAKNIHERLNAHRIELNRAFLGKHSLNFENKNLLKLAREGVPLEADILFKLPKSIATKNQLRFYEDYFIKFYGGYKKTYNTAFVPPPIWWYDGFNKVK